MALLVNQIECKHLKHQVEREAESYDETLTLRYITPRIGHDEVTDTVILVTL